MPLPRSICRHPMSRRVVLRTRQMIHDAGLPTDASVIIACSGGADSTALAAILASASGMGTRTIAHIRHDQRPATDTLEDVRSVESLAVTLGLPCALGRADAVGRGTEAAYRELRYRALGELAREHGALCIATAHHADDQLETLLMRLTRGASHRGMRGISSRRTLACGVHLIRPMLETTAAEARALCREAGLDWREDPTNADPNANRRAAFRAWIASSDAPSLAGAGRRATRHARLMCDVAALVEEAADSLESASCGEEATNAPLERSILATARDIVIGEVIRRRCRQAGGRSSTVDAAKIERLGRAIRSPSTEPKRIQLGDGVEARILATKVIVERVAQADETDQPNLPKKTPAREAGTER